MLTYSQATLDAKLSALRGEFGFSAQTITSNPSLIGYSVSGRIRPRAYRLRALLRAHQDGRLDPPNQAPGASLYQANGQNGMQGKRKRLQPLQRGLDNGDRPAAGNGNGRVQRLRANHEGATPYPGPRSGVPGITEDGRLMFHIVCMPADRFEALMERYESRVTPATRSQRMLKASSEKV